MGLRDSGRVMMRVASGEHARIIAQDLEGGGISPEIQGKVVWVRGGRDAFKEVYRFVMESKIPYYRYVQDIIPVHGEGEALEPLVSQVVEMIPPGSRVLVRVRPTRLKEEVIDGVIQEIFRAGRVPETKEPQYTLYLVKYEKWFAGVVPWEYEREFYMKKKEIRGVSRAYFKIWEALARVGKEVPGNAALDLGAAPGGWTQFLAEKGFTVVAVDPAEMDERIKSLGNVIHLRRNAFQGETVEEIRRILEERGLKLGLVASDMNADPREVAQLLLDKYDPLLEKGGLVVMTIKMIYKGRRGRKELEEVVRKMFEARGYDILFMGRLLANTKGEKTLVGQASLHMPL